MPAGGKTLWTPEQDEVLRTYISVGASYREIGIAMGCGKNAALARAHRLGFGTPKPRPIVRPTVTMPASGKCQFALNADRPFVWCAASVSQFGSPWCAEHRAIVFLPAKQKDAPE